ncbi:MAG: AAA family ATPase [Thermodesulfobacteriota bacterium]
MKIESLELYNFRQFYGQQLIRFSTDNNRNVTVITGVMGAGKTGIMHALRWCLYGSSYEGVQDIGELINKRAQIEAPINTRTECRVQIKFFHEKGHYIVTRSLFVDKVSEGIWNREPHEVLTVAQIWPDGRYDKLENPEQRFIPWVMPSNLSQYFFFDGEKIDQFARPGHEEEVEDAVRNVLKIAVLDRSKKHLETVAKAYQKDLVPLANDELKGYIEANVRLETFLEKQRAELKNLQNERSTIKKQLEEIDQRLAEIQAVRELQIRREEVEKAIKNKVEERKRLWTTLRETCSKGAAPLVENAIEKAVTLLDEKREHGEMPPGIREQFLDDLINREMCICKRPIIKDSEQYYELIRLKSKTVSSDFENTLIRTAGDLRALLDSAKETKERISEMMKNRVRLDDDLEDLEQEKNEISDKVKNVDMEEPASLEKKRTDYQDKDRSLYGQQQVVAKSIEETLPKTEEMLNKIARFEIKQKAAKKLQQRFTLASGAADAIAKMIGAFAAEMRIEIQNRVQEIFGKLVWKESQFKSVTVSDDYRLEVHDRWGLPARPELSAGERQLLSLAFIVGMSQVTGEDNPLIIDTPFGRISKEPRANITKHIPEIAKQLVLLVTDEELHSQARANLEQRIGAEYELFFDDSVGCSSIKMIKSL